MAELLHINVPSVMVRLAPDEGAEASNMLLYGEAVRVMERDGEWNLVQSVHDGYEGYVPSEHMKLHQDKTHRVCVGSTHAYSAPDFKAAPRNPLYFGSCVHLTAERQDGFVRLANGGWVFEAHLYEIYAVRRDIAETALLFKGAPYLWGGRSVSGVDCSGLVQLCAMAAGVECPRDSREQAEALGETLEAGAAPTCGDIVFFDGHVGIMMDEHHILNATARHMRVVVEPLDEVSAAYSGVKAVRRV